MMGSGRDMEGCGKFVKWMLFLINFLIFVGGLVVLSVGIWTLADKAFIQRLLRNELFISSAYILIVAGFVIVVISFLGCFGSIKEIKCMLLTYFVALFLMFVVLIVGGVLGYVFRNQVEDNLRPEMRLTIEEYDPDQLKNPVTAAWDDTQRNLKCCGMGISDLENKPWLAWRMNRRVNPNMESKVPLSCCLPSPFDETRPLNCTDGTDPSKIFQADCFTIGLAFVKEHAFYLGAVAIGISSFMREKRNQSTGKFSKVTTNKRSTGKSNKVTTGKGSTGKSSKMTGRSGSPRMSTNSGKSGKPSNITPNKESTGKFSKMTGCFGSPRRSTNSGLSGKSSNVTPNKESTGKSSKMTTNTGLTGQSSKMTTGRGSLGRSGVTSSSRSGSSASRTASLRKSSN